MQLHVLKSIGLKTLMLCSAAYLVGCTQSFSTQVSSQQKIDEDDGNFSQALVDGDQFARSLANLGDLESDGVTDVAVGVPYDDDGGTDRGAIWILFMDDNGTVDIKQKISDSVGDFSGVLDNEDHFGFSVAPLGDLNNDGFLDVAVGAPGDDDGGTNRGAVWILFLDANGRVQSEQKIANEVGGLGDVLNDEDQFGSSLAVIDDLNNDGIKELVVGAPYDDDDGTDRGAVWVLFMNNDGTISGSQKISSAAGSFQGDLIDSDYFGTSIAQVGDFDNDGINELAVGAIGSDDAGTDRGAVWLLYLNSNGTVDAEDKIAQGLLEFDGVLANGDGFGSAVADLGDMNGDGVNEIVIGASGSDDGGTDRGAIWILFMDSDATIISASRISETGGNFAGFLSNGDRFGNAIANLGDLNADGVTDLIVSADGDDGNGTDRGAAWVLFLDEVETDTDLDSDGGLEDIYGGN